MPIPLSYQYMPDFQNFTHLPFIFTSEPSIELLNTFVEALNENGHLPYTVSLKQLLDALYVQIAHTPEGEFIGGCTIKHSDGVLAEIGYMLVNKKYRRLGVADYMTQLRISHAKQLQIKILYVKVKGNNTDSMNNLYKAGFQSMGIFLSERGLYSAMTWLYLPLKPMTNRACRRYLQHKLDHLTSAIGFKYASNNINLEPSQDLLHHR